ncbi:DNRLRE domain-containing protein [Micromonospora peucetia]|uniref:RHS repeat-associated core domain-containing protein n=1 Tax=Micromonospora peucetia TaxID=47871 RepID=A0A1C6VTT8_9ACTN|nr:DNRLRE domain-containing protein [Micromonospora peucetia]SCL69514.1 RHS repeat-associated core domain-containing protein [Micromonospora peucetia]
MKRKLRGPLIAGLVVALAATVGATEALSERKPENAATTAQDDGLLPRLGDAAKGLVDGGSRPAKPEVVSAGLAVQEKAAPAKVWPPQRRVRELTGKRTENSRVYQLSDGRTQAEISAVPLHYQDAKGRYQPIDTTVRPTNDKGYVQGNRTNSFTSLFGDSTDDLVRFERGGRSIELGLLGAAKGVTPRVSGSTVTYPGLAGGADIVYEVTASALKEKIVLRRAPVGPGSYTFTLETAGLTAQQREDGSIAFVRPTCVEPVFVMPAPFMYDDKDDKSSPHGKVWSDKVTQKVTQSGGTSTITVSADAGWLADQARVYPVVIDPTIKIQPVPADGQDVAIYSGNPTKNYNDTYQLNVGTDESQTWRSLLKFDVASAIPANTTIDDAQLQLYYSQTHTQWAYDVPMEARRITTAWAEDDATWANTNGDIAGLPAGNVVTVDDGDAGTSAVGTWPYSANPDLAPKAVNADYRANNDATTGDTHTWVPTLTESGNYRVDVHFVGAFDRATNAPYTVHYNGGSKTYPVNQTTPDSAGGWVTLGTHPFVAGTTGRVVLGDVAGKAVVADAVRFTKVGAVKQYAKSSVWNSFPVRNLVQDWVNNTHPNHGFMVKALDESTKNRGGPIYEASEYAYANDRRDFNLPRLVVTYGRPGVAVDPPTTITSTGAVLGWPAYVDPSTTTTADDIVEYQVHRSVNQNFTPLAATLVAPVSSGTRTYQDTTAVPTAADNTDPMARKFYYYMVAVKTQDGQLIAGPTQSAMLPKAGQITRIYRTGVTDTTLSATRPTENVDVYDGDPYVGPGNNSTVYGDSRGVVRFPTLTGVPADAQVVGAELRMYNTYLYPGDDTDEFVDVHRLTRPFDETTASWTKANATTAWTTPGGDYDTTWKAGFNGFTNDPEWATWDVTSPVKGWVSAPTSNNGLLLRMRDEVNQTARAMLLSSEGQEPLLRPTLEVTYLEQTAESTYYAASTPQALTPNATYALPVTVSNPTLAAWNPTDWELSYDWKRADGVTDGADTSYELRTALPKSIPAGGTVDVTAQVKTPPSSTEGNKRTDYVLQWQLRNKITGKWLSETTPIKALPQNVAVEEPTSDQLGLEKFYSYAGKNTGAGGTLMNNLYAGNTVWSYNAFSNPSRGLSTFVRLAYNSLDTSDTVAGHGWSLQASSMMRLGTPLDFHPNPNPTKVTLTDGDGTSHRFTWDAATSEWKSPKGVHLYLQKHSSVDCKPNTQEPKAWLLTKPDRTRFFYDCEGFLSSVVENNGNEMRFVYEERKSNNKPTKFLRYLTDATGRQTLTIDYYAKGQAFDYINDTTWTRQSGTNLTNPKIIDHVSQITDISGRKLTFTYTDKGLLGELIDGAGSSQPKTFKFAYDMTQGNKNVKLVKATDPRGNATELAYHYPQAGDDPKWHWRTKSYKDRLTHLTQFGYVDPDATNDIRTTVTDAENHATVYLMDGYGRPKETTNAKNQTTKLGWDDDHNVIRLEEANQAVSTWAYDAKTGYPTEIKDAEAVRNGTPGTVLTYQRQLNGHVADLIGKTSPEGRQHTFGYEADGDLAWVVDPMGNTTPDPEDYKTSYTYDAWGQMLTATDANGNVTVNNNFDPNGYPKTITDAKNKSTTFVYDVRGNVLKVTDAYSKDTTQTYDTFGRPLENRVPKDQSAGDLVVTPAPKYDENDNVYESYAPNGAVSKASYDQADQVTYTLAPVDVTGDPERKTSFTYDKVGNLVTTTEPKGNLTPTVAGDFVTTNAYDEIYQLTNATNAEGHRITYEYDIVGNVHKVIDPVKNASAATDDYTTLYEYDWSHRLTRTTDALGKFTTSTYDRDGLVKAATDQLGNTTEVTFDPRGMPSQVKAPHKNDAGTITYRTTKYEYDEVGNQTRTISPRGVATTDDPDDFATVTVYDELNRAKETRTAYDKDDARYKTADVTTYEYDFVGRLAKASMPPSAGETVRNDTTYTYFDNGLTKTSSDPWDIVTSYDYDKLGAQTGRTVTSAGGSSNRTMTWSYFPDGKLKSRTDDGVPVGRKVVLVDNSDFNNTATTGTWTAATSATNKYGHNYVTRPTGTGANTFTWQLNVPQAGTYEAFARYPNVTGAATDAKFTVKHGGGDTVKTVNQTAGAGTWVSLGSYSFTEGNSHKVSLSDQAGGTVVADAVKLVRNNTGEADNEKVDYAYRYDPNGNLQTITDASPGARVDTYTVAYTGLNQVQTVTEKKSGTVRNNTTYTYNENSAPKTTTHDSQYASYGYDPRDLVSTVINGKSATDPDKKTTTFTYTDRGELLTQAKGNGNTVDHTYYLDGALKSQVEKKPNGTLVSEHTYTYDLNGNRTRDVARKMNADNHAAYLDTTSAYTYDPRDRLSQLVKTGHGADTETYVHDANNNVIDQTIKNATTTFNYDRNRMLTASTGGATASYNYDPFGRLDTVTAAGTVIERNVYDGFDHVIESRKTASTGTSTTKYTFDPLDRTTTKTTDVGGTKEKTTTFNYLGLSGEVLNEEVAGEVTKSYQYSPWGQRLSQITHKDDGSEEDAYYGYNPHTDVEQLTDETGNTKATYGYTAYGKNDDAQFTGIDKPDAADPTKEPYNAYRFNSKRWDQNSESYDMGFRDYSPGLNRFLSRDSYNGALADMNLGADPWTGNRYAFGGGNPISAIEMDGHSFISDIGSGIVSGAKDFFGGVVDGAKGLWGDISGSYAEAGQVVEDASNGDWGSATKRAGGLAVDTYTKPYKMLWGMVSDVGATWWGGVQAAAEGDLEGWARAGTKNGLTMLSFAGPAKGAKISKSTRADSASTPAPPRRVVEGGRADGEIVFSGHSKHKLSSGNVTVPEGTKVAVYAPYSKTLDDAQGFAVESGSPWMKPVRTYKSGESMPNFTLLPPSGLRIRANSVTVQGPTLLGDLLRPNMGTCHWAACSVTAR